jgi:histone H3/H4
MAKKKAKKTTAKKTTKKKTMEPLYVASKVKTAIKGHKMNMAGDALDGLNAVIYQYVEQAAKRAQLNGRKTVRSHDFSI